MIKHSTSVQYSTSLRLRLLLLIILPLIVLCTLLGIWRYYDAKKTANELFDRALLSAALAISRDVAMSEGDALSPMTLKMISGASGGKIFYHVAGGNGYYVTGYSYPPAVVDKTNITSTTIGNAHYSIYNATYRKKPVHVLKLTETIYDSLLGKSTITVWRQDDQRNQFINTLIINTMILMGVILVSLIVIVWFGVHLSLRPLNNLHEAISLRSSDNLRQIQRAVPLEISGIVATLNRLFIQVENSIESHKNFISDATHQLRNPIAGILSIAQSIPNAKTDAEKNKRLQKLITAIRRASRTTDQLLSLERLKHTYTDKNKELFDINTVAEDICQHYALPILQSAVSFEFIRYEHDLRVYADKLFVCEAIKNLLDNAIKHGGDTMTKIICQTSRHTTHEQTYAMVTIIDDGVGFRTDKTFARFANSHNGNGLGLAIAQNVAQKHGGYIVLAPSDPSTPKNQGTHISFAIKIAPSA